MAFHPQSQIILWLCNDSKFGPPAGCTLLSACPGLDHSVSGLPAPTPRPLKTRFPCGSPIKVSLAGADNSLTHYTKGTQSPRRAPAACTRTVSGSFHSPRRGSFRLSLTVLVRYRSPASIQPWRMVPPSSRRIPRVPRYSTLESGALPRTGVSPCVPGFPRPFRLNAADFWAVSRSLAATWEISFDFFSSGY